MFLLHEVKLAGLCELKLKETLLKDLLLLKVGHLKNLEAFFIALVQPILHLGKSALEPVLRDGLIGKTPDLTLLHAIGNVHLDFILIVFFPLLASHYHNSGASRDLLESRRFSLISFKLWNGNEFLNRKNRVEHSELFLVVGQLQVEVNLLVRSQKVFVELLE